MTSEEILDALNTGNFNRFLGEPESEILDCKSQPYNLATDRNTLELAKDVSSFANMLGGFIIVGLETERDDVRMTDVIRRIRLLDRGLINQQQYQDIINAWIFPAPTVSLRWCPSNENPERGLYVLEIAEHAMSDKPFLITRTLTDRDRRTEIVFGLAQRKGTTSQALSVRDLHEFIRDGRRFTELVKNRFDALEATLTTMRENLPAQQRGEDIGAQRDIVRRIESRMHAALQAGDLEGGRSSTLIAFPNERTELRTIFNPAHNTIWWHLEHPPELRQFGWSLSTLDNAQIVEGTLIRVRSRNKVIDLYRDGWLLFAGSADADFYCWGRPENDPKINSLAMIEAIYNFIRFYGLVIEDMDTAPNNHYVVVHLRNLHKDGIQTYMMPYSNQSYAQLHRDKIFRAPSERNTIQVVFTQEEILDIGAATYSVVREIYLWFGMDEEKIPYKQTEGERTFIDPALFDRG